MKSIVFIAPPAAGKGTQSLLIKEKYNIPHISTGDLLREAIEKHDERGKYIEKQMVLGNLVSDDIILELLAERLNNTDCDNGYILDGFPRNLEQAYAYDELLKKIGKELGIVIVLELDKEEAKKRIVGRHSCPQCGEIYNTMFEETKPLQEGLCNKCYIPLIQRIDDNEETFNKRFDTYIEKTAPLIDHYEKIGVLYRVNSGINKETTFKSIQKILNNQENL